MTNALNTAKMHTWSVWADTNAPTHTTGDMSFLDNQAVINFFTAAYPNHTIEDFSDEIHVYAPDADWDDDDLEPVAGAQYEGEATSEDLATTVERMTRPYNEQQAEAYQRDINANAQFIKERK